MLQQRERLGDRLYGRLLEQIVSGTVKEGEKLPSEKQICATYQVSRQTVREALGRLHADGMVITRQGSGTFVQKRQAGLVRLDPVSDMPGMLRGLEVRAALEPQAAALAALRRTADQISEINRCVTMLRAAFDNEAVPTRADYAFHRAVAIASGNPFFVELLDLLNSALQHTLIVTMVPTRAAIRDHARRVVEEHETIARAIEQRDGEAAELAMRYHMYRSRRRLIESPPPRR